MSYSKMLKTQVRNAFKLAKDLALPITLQQKNVSDFNFTTQQPVETAITTVTTKFLKLKEGRSEGSDKNPSRYMEILLSAEDITDPDIYDKAIIGSETWNIVPPYETEGFIIKLKLSKEA